MIINLGVGNMTDNILISPAQIDFTNECLNLYKECCEPVDRDALFLQCVQDRLNYLLIANTNKIDETLNLFESFTDNVVVEDVPFVRCENYSKMVKNKNKSNINYMKKLFKIYNKSCLMSTVVLQRLLKLI